MNGVLMKQLALLLGMLPLLTTLQVSPPPTAAPPPPNPMRAYELSLGHCIDSLNSFYPNLLTTPPDKSLFSDKVTLVDPGGVVVSKGIEGYGMIHKAARGAAGVFFHRTSYVEHKLIYDWARSTIRASFVITLIPKSADPLSSSSSVLLGSKASHANSHVVVSAISEYTLDADALILNHKISNVRINDKPFRVAGLSGLFREVFNVSRNLRNGQQGELAGAGGGFTGTFSGLGDSDVIGSLLVPTGGGGRGASGIVDAVGGAVNLSRPMARKSGGGGGGRGGSTTALQAMSDGAAGSYAEIPSNSEAEKLERDLEAHNLSRSKFGLKGLTKSEFKDLTDMNGSVSPANLHVDDVVRMEGVRRERDGGGVGADAETLVSSLSAQFSSLLKSLTSSSGKASPIPCDTYLDCPGQQCCDMIFAKICCNNGLGVAGLTPEFAKAMVRVKADNGEEGQYGGATNSGY